MTQTALKRLIAAAGPVIACMLSILFVDIVLYGLSQVFPSLALPPSTWGTYANWAAVVVPTVVGYLTVRMWIVDKRLEREESLQHLLNQVTLERRAGGDAWCLNRTGAAILISFVKSNGVVAHLGAVVANNEAQDVGPASLLDDVEVFIDGVPCRLKFDALPEILRKRPDISIL